MKLISYFGNKKIIINICIYALIFYLLIHSKVITSSISSTTNLFTTKILPALFPYLLITELLINSGKINNLSIGLDSFLAKLFHVPKNTISCIIIGFLLGYPNAAKYILKLYDTKQIDSKIATKLISFTSNANISYIIATVGIGILGSIEIGIILAISHFLAAIIIGLCYVPLYNNSIIQQTLLNSNSFKKIYSPFELLYSSIGSTLKTLAYIFAYTIIFSFIPIVLLNHFELPDLIKSLIIGLFELSNGINSISTLNINLNIKIVLASFILSFSSIMIIVQIFSFAYKAKVKFKNLLLFKFLHGLLSCIITYIIIHLIYTPTINVFSNTDIHLIKVNILPSTVYMFSLTVIVLLILLLFRKKRQG